MKKPYNKYSIILKTAAAFAVVVLIILISKSIPPKDFVRGTVIKIPSGMGISEAATLLAEKKMIKLPFVYKSYVQIIHWNRGIQAGDYLFQEPQSALRVAYRMAYGVQGLEKIKVTVPEGLASSDVGRLITKILPNIDAKKFAVLGRPYEGRLFPDTYFFYENVTSDQIIKTMTDNFDYQVKSAGLRRPLGNKPFDQVLIMASILEEEANNSADRRKISGVLWKRLDAGMALQIDAPFFYLLGRTSSELTTADLATTSPYNTYTHVGLPPTPISNPGLDSIKAALNPETTTYWFYLADSNGVTHYAVDHEGHVANKDKYLR